MKPEGGFNMNWEVLVWFGIMLAFLVVEAACPLHLVSIWFSAGALVAMIAAVLHASIAVQIVLFVAVSAVLLICLWPFTRKFLKPKLEKTNVDATVGQRGHVTEDIDNIDATGQVKLGGMYWTARSVSGENIPKGTLVEVDHIEGVRAFVKVVEESKV
jgi:membrane protein implicated in regulation of membrane protease activity